MRYTESTGKITVTVSELVTLARRGISPALDAERALPSALSDAKKSRIIGNQTKKDFSLDVTIEEHILTVIGTADRYTDGVLSLIRVVEHSRDGVSKQDREMIRGEGFLLAYMLTRICSEGVVLRTVYTDAGGNVILDESETPSKASLEAFFNKCVSAAAAYARPEIDRVTKRLPSFKAVKFPYKSIRDGQRDFIHAVYNAISHGTQLYASAPTGTGKTVSVLYPAIKALGDKKCDKVFYLTPKHTTGDAASACLELFRERGALIRAIRLYSKEVLCTENLTCRRSNSPCSLNSLKSIPDAIMRLYSLDVTVVGFKEIRKVAKELSVCPHELALCYSELCDVVICDFNYLFDPNVYLRRYFTNGGSYAYLIDEAHNLPDRAREMYSTELSLGELDGIISSPLLANYTDLLAAAALAKDELYSLLYPYLKEEIRTSEDGIPIGATHLSDLPCEMYSTVEQLLYASESAYRRASRERDENSDERLDLLRELYYKIKGLYDTMGLFDERYRMFIFFEGGVLRFKLFCLDTGGVIGARVATGRGTVFFSATLEPIEYYRSLLGADRASNIVSISSPFDPSQLCVSIVDRISTRYSERGRTVPAVCRTIAAVMSAKRGNYMVFCPSFEYLELISSEFIKKYPKIRALVQRRDMSQAEKREFLDAFSARDGKYLVGFCVLGGIYSEGVDLVGDSLIGAIIVGIGMPQLSYEREAMRDYYSDKYEAGTEYAYLYPGMNKVFQAAGRVIRRENDRGVIVLIDDRFADPIYKKSIPELWHGMRYVADANELKARIENFWERVDRE